MPFLNLKFKISNLKFTKGFSLVELLVVVAILGILASITSIALIGHQKQARDAQRKSDLQQFKKAMQSVKNDCRNASYYTLTAVTNPIDENTQYTNQSSYLRSNLKYLQSPLQDPKYNVTNGYFYRYAQGGGTSSSNNVCPTTGGALTQWGFELFVLRAKLENTSDPDISKSYTNCSTTITTMTSAAFDPANPPSAGDGFYYVCGD